MEYEFKLIFKIPTSDFDFEKLMHKLADAGCTDALVGLGVAGHVGLEFIRESVSAHEAVYSAIADVKKALPSAKLIEAYPDLVGLTDVAEIIGVSRQNMRKLMVKYPDNFPSPVHSGSTSIWHLSDILVFLENRKMSTPEKISEIARETMRVNLIKDRLMHQVPIVEGVEGLLAT